MVEHPENPFAPVSKKVNVYNIITYFSFSDGLGTSRLIMLATLQRLIELR